eukprot:3897914-Pyramimonas_sp.AAC.1
MRTRRPHGETSADPLCVPGSRAGPRCAAGLKRVRGVHQWRDGVANRLLEVRRGHDFRRGPPWPRSDGEPVTGSGRARGACQSGGLGMAACPLEPYCGGMGAFPLGPPMAPHGAASA